MIDEYAEAYEQGIDPRLSKSTMTETSTGLPMAFIGSWHSGKSAVTLPPPMFIKVASVMLYLKRR